MIPITTVFLWLVCISALCLGIGEVVVGLLSSIRHRRPKDSFERVMQILAWKDILNGVSMICSVILAFMAARQSHGSSIVRLFYGMIAILTVGLGLTRFKQESRFWYGWAELMFAISVGLIGLYRLPDSVEPSALVAIFSSAYLCARAFDNIFEGKKNRR